MNNLPYLVRVYKGRNRETRLEKMVRLVTIEGFSSCADERHDPKGSTTHCRLLNKNIIRRKKKILKASREKRHILQKRMTIRQRFSAAIRDVKRQRNNFWKGLRESNSKLGICTQPSLSFKLHLNINKKMGKNSIARSPKQIQKWPTRTQKDIQHH